MKKIATITTTNHNVGDDFVREGILYLLKQRFKNIENYNIHKHAPVTVRKNFRFIRKIKTSNLLDKLPIIKHFDKIISSDILIQSGAPVYWCHNGSHCSDNEWYKPLIIKRYAKVKNKVPFLNIGAGACQQYNSKGDEFKKCTKCRPYIKELSKLSTITTVRDKLAKKILGDIGIDAKLLPCPSIFVSDNLNVKAKKPKYVCLNYMKVCKRI